MTVGVACGSCGTELRGSAKFCDECGAPTAVSADAAKYKQVTVLFADVVRSMDLASAVDLERLRDIMNDLLDRCATVVRRYGGTVQSTGDGVMALFGAPVALEDHASRGCLAALAIQAEASSLAADVARLDGLTLQVRVGLNSGRVIAGEIGSGSLGYAATGETVGFAQRMESAAPPGGVMLSESTASLVEHSVVLGEPQWVHIKGSEQPVRARPLLAAGSRDELVGRADATLVGRRWEMAALKAIMDRAVCGQGGVVNVVGPPGIGKSRVAREAAALAAGRGVEVFWAFGESHARDIPFHVAAQLLRATRERLRAGTPGADPEDLLLLDDLLGIADREAALPQIDPDARGRRLTALINAATLARTEPTLFIIEDAHWIDATSESMVDDFLTVVPRSPSVVLITARPEYEGLLAQARGAQAIALAPLADSDTGTLLTELLGEDPSITELAAIITERADGNPFFAEEMVRELVQRGVLTGERGRYLCDTDAADVAVPATVQAAIAARIDRLTPAGNQTLTAASVIGVRFESQLLTALGIDAALDELLGAELIDQVRFTPSAQYAFRHPLIRAVAYESQLKSDRTLWHRRVAEAIQGIEPGMADDNAALIAEHLESAGDAHAAYGWHMRAAASSANRNSDAARVGWARAAGIVDTLPPDDPARLSMQIAPLTMLCATDWQGRDVQDSQGRFERLRELCDAAGDKVSLAVGMTGLITELQFACRSREAARLVSEQRTLLESIGDPGMTVGLAFQGLATLFDLGEFEEILQYSQTVIELADGDPTVGAGFGVGSPLAIALTMRGIARGWLGRPDWRQDLEDAVAMTRDADPATRALILNWTYGVGIVAGMLRADDSLLAPMEAVMATAERASGDLAVILAQYELGGVLLYRGAADEHLRGRELAMQSRNMIRGRIPSLIPVIDLVVGASDMAHSQDSEQGVSMMRRAVNEFRSTGRVHGGYGSWALAYFAEKLLEHGGQPHVSEAEEAIDQLADIAAQKRWILLDVALVRLQTLLARARSDDATYRDSATRYLEMAKSFGFEGHIAFAEALIE